VSDQTAEAAPASRGAPALVRALRDYLVAPAPAPGADEETRSAPDPLVAPGGLPPAIAVVADERDVAALAAAVALLGASTRRARCGVVVLVGARGAAWLGADAEGGRPAGAPAVRSARKLRAILHARGLTARARGRLVTVDAGPAGPAGHAAAERALAVATGAAAVAVVGIAAPRPPLLDPVVAACDRALVLVRPGREAVLGLAVDGMNRLGVPTAGATASVGGAARLVCARGYGVPRPLRRRLTPLLGGLPVDAGLETEAAP